MDPSPTHQTPGTVRVAVIGAGAMARRVHYPALAAMKDVKVVALCDLDEARLHQTGDAFGVGGRYTSYRRMVEETAPDAVYIILRPAALYPVVMDILQMRRHVFIEKPPGLTRGQTKQMALEAERHGCVTMVGFNRRFIPVLREAKRSLEERGPIVHAVVTFYKNAVGEGPPEGGAIDLLTYDAIHAVDTLRWIGGEVTEVVSDVRALYAEYDNAFTALLRFAGGAVGVLSTMWVAGARIHTFELHSRGASAFVDGTEGARIYAGGTAVYRKDGSGLAAVEPTFLRAGAAAGGDEFFRVYGYWAESRHFLDCVKAGLQPETNFADALKTMTLVERIYRSQRWP